MRWAVLAAASSVVLAACSGAGGGGKAGALRIGYDFSSEFTNTFDPAKSSGNCDDIVTSPIYDTLIHQNAGGSLEPGLATSWSINGDIITLHLRPGVTFSNGEAFNATAVKNGLLHDKLNTTLSELADVISISVVNPLTVTIRYLNNTGIELLYGMTGREGEIPAPDDLTKAGSDPIGAGPYEFVSYSPGSELVLKQNPNYWDKSAITWAGSTTSKWEWVRPGSQHSKPIRSTWFPSSHLRTLRSRRRRLSESQWRSRRHTWNSSTG